MGLWGRVGRWVGRSARRRAGRDAGMALCALVAAADGHVDHAEMRTVEELILGAEVFQGVPAERLRSRFHRHVGRLTRDFARGKEHALHDIARAAADPGQARAVVRAGIAVAGADGHFSQAEAQVLREACAVLGLDPGEFAF